MSLDFDGQFNPLLDPSSYHILRRNRLRRMGGETPEPYVAKTFRFDGVTDHLLRSTAFAGAPVSGNFFMDCALSFQSAGGSNQSVTNTMGANLRLRRNTANTLNVQARDDTSSIFAWTSTATFNTTNFLHILASTDGVTGWIHINGVAAAPAPTLNNLTINYAFTQWAIGGTVGAGQKPAMDLNRLIVHPQFVPEAQSTKFWNNGQLVDQGPTSSIGLGVQPLLSVDANHQTVANINAGNQLGTGGVFDTVTGAVVQGPEY